jgi:4-amino-4-deoxy-L-arabinose transferase-like glycosyltransferase
MSLLISGVWLITLLGAAVRLAYLNHPMRYDEAYNYLHFASQSPNYVATHYMPNNHILHTLLVRFAIEVFGTAPAALRLPAYAAGVLIIPATAWLAWLLSRRASVAWLAALAVCCSSPLIEYSVNARGYSLLALFTVLSAVCVYKAIESPGKRFWWVWGGSLGAAGIYTVPVMVMPLFGLGVVVLVNALRQPVGVPRRRELLGGLALTASVCASFAGLLYLPVLVAGGTRSLTDSGRMAYDILGQQIGSPGAMLVEAWRLWMRHVPALAEVLLAFGAVAYLVRAVRTPSVERWLPPAIVFISVGLATAFGAPLPARAWLFALPVFFVFAVQGACELFPREPETVPQRALAGCVLAVLTVIPLFSLASISQSPYLCAEPRGLIEVEEALDECQVFGPERCALVAPYSPATAYYAARKHMAALPLPTSPRADRVYIVADENRGLDELWHAGVEGFAAFDPPRVWRTLRQSTVYFADRTARSALR